ncbi:MAG: saccharopine dehydrogenase NADP-binding domain-containing protein [Bacteroidia bacterium]|nr:saccharopine dehydrogenase NADP-binding domain-containing protein [Bacteroidia bacterium]
MKKITILGAGMVGRAMAIDLSRSFNITSADMDVKALELLVAKHTVKTVMADLSDTSVLTSLISDADLVICALPGHMGFKAIKTVIEAGKDLVDISFMPEDYMVLNDLALENNVTVVADCGVAPGMPNLLAGFHNETMQITDFFYMVGGLPLERKFPFEYKAPFSPVDVVEEYTRPARYVEDGKVIIKPAMSDPELVFFQGIGHLEAFNTDGLRSLILTMKHVPNMKEKTLRYPGHIRLIQALQNSGFFNNDPIQVKGVDIIPFDFTTKLLFKEWKLGINEPEFTVMRIQISGTENGQQKEVIYNLLDRFDPETGISSMARTTGYTATATANLILGNHFNKKGVFPPESVGSNKNSTNFILDYLSERGINYVKTERYPDENV